MTGTMPQAGNQAGRVAGLLAGWLAGRRAGRRLIMSHQNTLGGISLLRRATVDGSDAFLILHLLAAASATSHHHTANLDRHLQEKGLKKVYSVASEHSGRDRPAETGHSRWE